MINVGVTGGMGSGKSEVSARLAHRGVVLVDADLLAREAVVPGTAGLAAVAARCGSSVLAADDVPLLVEKSLRGRYDVVVVDNTGALDELLDRVDAVWRQLRPAQPIR